MPSNKKSPRIVVSALIKKGNKFLLTRELLENKEEMWIIPGGGVDFGEGLEQALIREIKEELGMGIKVLEFVKFHQAIFPQFDYHSVIFFFLAEPVNNNLQLERKILEAKYFTKKQMQNLNLVDSALWLKEY